MRITILIFYALEGKKEPHCIAFETGLYLTSSETKFKGSSLRDLRKDSINDVVNSIERSLSTISELAVCKNQSVLDPVLFISLIEKTP